MRRAGGGHAPRHGDLDRALVFNAGMNVIPVAHRRAGGALVILVLAAARIIEVASRRGGSRPAARRAPVSWSRGRRPFQTRARKAGAGPSSAAGREDRRLDRHLGAPPSRRSRKFFDELRRRRRPGSRCCKPGDAATAACRRGARCRAEAVPGPDVQFPLSGVARDQRGGHRRAHRPDLGAGARTRGGATGACGRASRDKRRVGTTRRPQSGRPD